MPIQKDILTQNVLSQAKDEKQGISEKKRPIYNREEGAYIYNKEKTEEITKQRKEIINKRRDYNEKRIPRRENSQEEEIHKKREFTRRGNSQEEDL